MNRRDPYFLPRASCSSHLTEKPASRVFVGQHLPLRSHTLPFDHLFISVVLTILISRRQRRTGFGLWTSISSPKKIAPVDLHFHPAGILWKLALPDIVLPTSKRLSQECYGRGQRGTSGGREGGGVFGWGEVGQTNLTVKVRSVMGRRQTVQACCWSW